jgi:molybdopterin synthase sulfur carrier subunit
MNPRATVNVRATVEERRFSAAFECLESTGALAPAFSLMTYFAMIRVILPPHLRTLAQVRGDVELDVPAPATLRSALDTLETRYPMLRGTIRDHDTQQRRPFLRFFACEQDLSHESPDFPLPEAVVSGKEPLVILGAIAGG